MAIITTINSTDNITDSRAVINTNLSNLNTDKLEASDITGKQDILLEGAFIDGDKTKLDGIETAADVTDTTNVTAAGALMDSELTSIADVKALNQSVVSGAAPVLATTNMTEGTDKNFVSDIQLAKIENGQMLTSTDCDTITTGGRYGMIGTPVNGPVAGEFFLNVMNDGTRAMQIATMGATGISYVRIFSGTWGSWVTTVISDATITTTDITTNNATILKHGFLPKLSGTSTEYLDGSGAFSTPAGGGGTPEGTAVLSTGETVGKVLQADGDNTCSWVTLPGGGDALTTNPLSQFAATTSAQFAGVISDETGTGSVVLATSPTLVTPVLGVATATSINGATITSGTLNGSVTGTNTGDQTSIVGITGTKAQFDTAVTDGDIVYQSSALGTPSSGTATNLTGLPLSTGVTGTLAIANGGTGATTLAGASISTYTGTETLTNKTLTDPKIVTSINTQTGLTYTLALTDASKSILANNAAAQAYTIPTNASVAFAIGTTLILTQYGVGDVTISGDTGVVVNGVALGGMSITSQYGTLVLEKIGTDEWLILGGAGDKLINAQTGTTYTLALTDNVKTTQLVTLSNAGAITLTIPTNATIPFPIGTQVDLSQQGAGAVTIGGAGITINSKDANLTSNGQFVGLSLVKIATDEWNLFGDLV